MIEELNIFQQTAEMILLALLFAVSIFGVRVSVAKVKEAAYDWSNDKRFENVAALGLTSLFTVVGLSLVIVVGWLIAVRVI